jgi:hypothetical protein
MTQVKTKICPRQDWHEIEYNPVKRPGGDYPLQITVWQILMEASIYEVATNTIQQFEERHSPGNRVAYHDNIHE